MFRTGELTRDIGATVMGKDAVEFGLIKQIGGVADAIRELNLRIDAHKSNKKEWIQ